MATTVKTVRKRDGEIKEFKPSKIIEAVRKAARSAKIELDEATYLKLIRYVTSRVSKLPEPIEIDQIHDAVEDALMKYNLFSVERSYHDKRVKRDEERFKQYAVIKEMDEKLSAKKPVQQNANLDEFSFGGKKGEMDSAYLKDKALKYYISDEHAKNHINNRIYIHDLDSYVVGMHNCVARDTEIITSDGIKRFYNFKDGDKIDVLASDGFFREATVKYYGKKQMQDVVLSRCGSSKKVKCTPDHRWILQDGTVTTSLQVGDKLIPLAKTEDCEDTLWKVESIKKCRGEFEAWCVEEPETHSFTLAGGIVTGNCLSTPMDELLANGLKTRQTNIRPAGSVSTAFQLVAVIFQLQSLQQFGGVAATHLDWTLVPYVRKSFAKHFRDGMKYIEGIEIELPSAISIEDSSWNEHPKAKEYALAMTKREIEQGAEGMLHNLNSLQSRSGNQLPFSSINYGTCTLLEGRMVIQAILEMTLKGTGSGQTSIFPCQIFQLMDGVNTKKGDKNYDLFKLALKCTAKRMYPNYVNCDWSNDQDVMDVKAKDEILANLTEAEKEALIKAIEKDPSLGDILGLDVVEE